MEGAEEVSISECVVCLQAFDESDHVPRVLSCGHSLCESCASSLSVPIAENRSQSSFLRCPECNQRSKLPYAGPRGLPKNIELLRFLQTSPTDSSKTKKQERQSSPRIQNVKSGRGQPRPGPAFHSFEGSVSELSRWIIPQDAARLLEEPQQLRPGQILGGEVFLFRDETSRKAYSATFLHVEMVWNFTSPKQLKDGKTSEYDQRIRSLLDSLSGQQRTEVFHLLRISIMHERVCTIFGFWMSPQGHLYLACRAHGKEPQQVWEASKLHRGSPKSMSATRECSLAGGLSGWNTELKRDCNLKILNNFVKIGREICELFMGLHFEGFIAGLLTPTCMDFDVFSHLILNVNVVLSLREALKDYIKAQFRVTGSGSSSTGGVLQEETDLCKEKEPYTFKSDLFENRPMREGIQWHYASPELLLRVHRLDMCSKTNITCKTDVWTLGCLLCNLFSGETPWDGIPLQDFFQKSLNHMQIADSWLGEKIKRTVLDPDDQSVDFVRLLIRCFAYEPKERPEVFEIWHMFNHLDNSSGFEQDQNFNRQDIISASVEGQSLENFWCFALECLVHAARNHPAGELATSITRISEGAQEEIPTISGTVEDGIKEVEEVNTLDGHLDYVTSLVVCGQYLLSASFDKSICVWSLHDDALLQKFKGHAHKVMVLAADQQLLLCFSGDYGGEIFVWGLGTATSDYLVKWHEHQDWRYTGVASLAVSTDGFLYSGSGDKTIKAWSLQDYSLVATMEGHKSLVSTLLIDGEVLYSGGWDGTIRLWWRADHSPLAVLGEIEALQLGAVRALAMSSGLLIAGYHSGGIQVWRDETCLNSVPAHDGVISTLCVSGDQLFSGSWDGTIKAWQVEELLDDATARVVDTCGSAVTSLAYHEGKLYAGLATKVIKVRRI